MVDAYPLCWPVGQKRTTNPQRAQFGDYTLNMVTTMLLRELVLMQVKDTIISSNVPLRGDGLPRADYSRRIITDKGVAVYFMLKGKQVVLACDRWDTVEDNMRALVKSIEAMRGLERWGVSEILERAFTGFAAIPEKTGGYKDCWDILGIPVTGSMDAIKKKYRELAGVYHPDKPGGSNDKMRELNEAYRDATTFADNLQH